jgi:subtilisin-like proprotein convertase family protein
MTPNDTFYADQWHFALIGDIETIWNEFTGAGVHVGVFDDGVQYTHPDLAPNYDASMHFVFEGVTYDGIAEEADEVHGTSVAGLIAAASNGEGVVGVSFGATMTGINIFDPAATDTSEKEQAQILWAQNFDIMSNSWGWTPDYARFQSLARPNSYLSQYDDWYAEVTANGRGGLGTVIVQAAGNDALNATDGVNVSRYTLTIAATDANGDITDYSNWGPSILVAAPASAVTTDRTGNAGYNATGDADPFPRDYTSDFGGTSAATPTTSGVVALMLQANPDLGWRDVANILAMSAGLTGSEIGGPGEGFEVGSWGTGGTTTWNGGGSAYHLSYGYGMVDAFAAVRMAEAWLVMHGAAQTSANERHVSGQNTADVPIPDLGSAESEVTIAQDIAVETIYVTVTILHSYAGDLSLLLVAPDGTSIPLFLNEGGDSLFDDGLTWTFAVEAARGYSSAGTWAVRAEDGTGGDDGSILSVELDFYGSEGGTGDVHTFTDDFLTLRDIEEDRGLVADADGGTDWLNLAALQGNIRGDMAGGGAFSVGGAAWFTLDAGDAFENVHAGDGNDVLDGNALANAMLGGRGDDRLRGLGGRDTLDGGQDDDRLTGGRGDDDFVFGTGFGADTVTDFRNNRDTLVFDADIWGGGLSVAEVISAFATATQDGVRFDFLNGATLLLAGFGNTGQLQDDIALV